MINNKIDKMFSRVPQLDLAIWSFSTNSWFGPRENSRKLLRAPRKDKSLGDTDSLVSLRLFLFAGKGENEMNANWLKVFAAAVMEVGWVIGITHAYNVWTWTVTVIFIILSNYLMISAGQMLPAGTVYAIFVGLGTGGTVIAEILFFGEPFKWEKILLIIVLLVGVIGLKLVTDESRRKGVQS